MKPVRTALFAPGSKDRVMAKALESGADAVILDLEDSVAITAKPEARKLIAALIDSVVASGKPAPGIFVRTNSPATGMLADDLAACRPTAWTVEALPSRSLTTKRTCHSCLVSPMR